MMLPSFPNLLLYALAAICEIAGCFAVWAWWKLDRSALWLAPGLVCLALFAWLLALVDQPAAGRVFAAYGGIYVIASVCWMALAEGVRPDRFDLGGALIVLIGALVIIAPAR